MSIPDSRKNILVVEDAEPIRKMVCSMLVVNGYSVLEAADGAEALTIVRDCQSIHLVITDVIMPQMNGADLARHLSREVPGLPIIFMSGYTEDPVVRSMEHVGSAFLAKPFTATALVEKVRQTLDDSWTDGRASRFGPQ